MVRASWLVVLALVACGKRNEIEPLDYVYGFDREVPSAAIDRARELVFQRVGHIGVVTRRGKQIVITPHEVAEGFLVPRALQPPATKLELRIEDSANEYLQRLGKYVKTSDVLNKFNVTYIVDYGAGKPGPIDYYLRAENDLEYVNEQWAKKHDCDVKDRLAGTGVPCIVDGNQLLDAIVRGDQFLFIEPPPADLAVPADHELVFEAMGKKIWRTRYLEREPIPLEVTATDLVRGKAVHLEIVVAQSTVDAIAARLGDKRMVAAFDGKVTPVKLAGPTLTLVTDDFEDLSNIHYALGLAALPARLVEQTTGR